MKTLHLKTMHPDNTRDCENPLPLETRETPMIHHTHGLQYTASGYGARIPTQYMVRYLGKWRRVYCRIFSNSGTCYIGKLSDNLIVGD